MADKSKDNLVDWTFNYLKNKDLYLKKIEVIEKNKKEYDIYVKFKDREQFFVVQPIIEDIEDMFSKFNLEKYFGLVVLNTKSNLNSLVDNWKEFVKFKHLCVYFVNPSSKLDKKWIIYPHTHNNICEKDALEKGLNSMFGMVEELNDGAIKDTF
jgi:hypothetical protein